jgi:hypothetical protein
MDVNALLNALRTVAQEENVEIGAFPLDSVPPVSESARDRIVQMILQAQGQAQGHETSQSVFRSPSGDIRAIGEGSRRRGASPSGSAHRSPRRFFLATSGLVAAAAVLAMWLKPTNPNSPNSPNALDSGFPAYSISASGGVRETRGVAPAATTGGDETTAASQRVTPASELVIVCRPETGVTDEVAARTFFVQGADVSEVHPRIQVAPSGAVELRLRGAELPGHGPGPAAVRVVVGRADRVRSTESRAALAGSVAPGLRWLTVPLDL